MDIYTVSFFGHRYVEKTAEIEQRLEALLHDIISQHEFVEFLIGRDGDFDMLASSVIKRAISKYSNGNTSFILVLPYMKADYRDNEQQYLDYYDEVEICEEAAAAHPKGAIQKRNRSLVDRSDLVICYIQHENGGAFQTVRYAQEQGKEIINLI